MAFKLPKVLPTDVEGLTALRGDAQKAFDELKKIVDGGAVLTEDQLAELTAVVEHIRTVDEATHAAAAAVEERRGAAARLISEAEATPEDEAEEAETEEGGGAEDAAEVTPEDAASVVAEAEEATQDAAEPALSASTGARRPVKTTFAGTGKGKTPDLPGARDGAQAGWKMVPGAPGYRNGNVGFADLAAALDTVKPGSRTGNRSNRPSAAGYAPIALANMQREVQTIKDPHELYTEITRATDQRNLPGKSLVAAGGWCAASETLYDFCDVPDATDLISVPEINIQRGGIRWPNELDMSAIFAAFQFFFTETQLEAVDGEGQPTAIKECVEIPCTDYTEMRLNAVGYCVEAGILQDQGWPELTENFMRRLAQEHLRAISRRTILDLVSGSGAVKIIPGTSQIAAGSAFLNALSLMAVNLRLNEGLARTAVVEFVAPSWVPEAIRADLANQEGLASKALTDVQLTAWLSARNLVPQWVGDWQTRDAGLPGNLLTLEWPDTVDVVMYPAGTWFRALSNVIELGVMYPKEQLQVNRYTRFFTEDAIAVGKRCHTSILVRVPICASGAIGARQTINCNTPSTQVNEVQSISATGTVSGGTYTLTFDGQTTGTIAWNASAATVKTALDALSNLAPADTVVAGGALPSTPVTVTFQGAWAGVNVPQMVADSALITGGGSINVTTTTQGHS